MTDDNDNGNTFSRRKILGGIATVGAAGAVAGSGTMAIFNDTEEANAQVTAGTLDLKVNGGDSLATLFTVTDAAPGDSGSGQIKVRNAGSVDGTVSISFTDSDEENGQNEPEADVDSTTEEGELSDVLKLNFQGGEWMSVGDFKSNFTQAFPLNPRDNPYTLTVGWKIPVSAGNEIQSDSYTLDAALELFQTDNVVTGTKKNDWPDATYDAAFQAKARYGNNKDDGNTASNAELSVGGSQDGSYSWTDGKAESFELEYDGSEATLTVGDDASTTSTVGGVTEGVVAITAKAYKGKTATVSDLVLNGKGLAPAELSATSGKQSFQTVGDAFTPGDGFTLSGTLTFSDLAGNGPQSEDPAVQFDVK